MMRNQLRAYGTEEPSPSRNSFGLQDEDDLRTLTIKNQFANSFQLLKYGKVVCLFLLIVLCFLFVFYGVNVKEFSPSVSAALFFLSLLTIPLVGGWASEYAGDVVTHEDNAALSMLSSLLIEHSSEFAFFLFIVVMGEERFACYVRTVMIGSILLHLLLVLGVSVVFTPMAEDQTVFGLQMLGSFGEGMRFCLILFMFPTLYEYMIAIPDFERSADTTTPLKQEQNVLLISRLLCACALPAYLLYLVNTIRSRYFDADGRLHFPTNWWYALTYYHTVHSREGIARGAHSEPRFTRSVALWGFSIFQTIEVLLCGVVACTLLPAARACALPLPFVLVVLIPLSFNAGELASSFLFSREGRVDMGASIAFHCMIDMVMWVMPVVVLFAWTMGRSLDLSCHPYLVSVCFFSVMIVSTEGSASRMRRLLGVMLLSLYALLVCTCLMGGWHLCQKKSYTKPTFHTTQKKGK